MRKRVSKGAPLSTFVWKLIGSPRQHSAMAISTSNSAGTAANEEATKEQSSRQAMDRRPSAVPQTNFHVQDARHTIKLLLSNTERHNTNRRDKERRKEGPTRRTRARERTTDRPNDRTNAFARTHTNTHNHNEQTNELEQRTNDPAHKRAHANANNDQQRKRKHKHGQQSHRSRSRSHPRKKASKSKSSNELFL